MTRRRGISIFRHSEAPALEETDLMAVPVFSADFVYPADASDADLASGSQLKVLCRQTPEEGGFSLVHVWFKPHFVLPQHTHDADCLYVVISGTAVLGSQVLGPGDGFFVPNGAPYRYSAGPDGVEVLEFRHSSSFDIRITETSERFAAILANAAQHAAEWTSAVRPLTHSEP